MLNLRQLEYLIALSETRNFRRAAERVNATQPTLSGQVKALETRLGAQLVERSKNKVMLTQLGDEVVGIARRMLADANEIRVLASRGGAELSGVLRLGLPSTIGPYLLPLVIPELQSRYPQLQLYVREELPGTLPHSLENGTYDLAISLLPVIASDLECAPLFREPLTLAVSKRHPLAAKKKANQSALKGIDILALGRGYQLHDAVTALCKDFGANLKYEYEGTSLDTLREMVAMNLGATFLPGLYVESVASRDTNIKTVKLEGRQNYRTVGLIWRKTTSRRKSYLELADVLRDAIRENFPQFVVHSSRI